MVTAALVTFAALLVAWILAPQGRTQETSTAEDQAPTWVRTSGLRAIIRHLPHIGNPARDHGQRFTE
jgi:hypothetical protein